MIQAVARCVYRHRQRYATLANTRVSTHDYATHICFSSFFRGFEIGFIVSIKWCSLQARRTSSRRKTFPVFFEKFLFKYLWTRRTSELTPFRTNYAASWNAMRVFQRLVTIQFFLSLSFFSRFVLFSLEVNKLRSRVWFIYLLFFSRVWSSGYTLKRCVNWGEWEFLCRVFVGCS